MYHQENDYSAYSAVDFVLDEDFVLWVKSQSKEEKLNLFFKSLLLKYPSLEKEMAEARHIVSHLKINSEVIEEKEAARIWNDLKIQHEEKFGKEKNRVFSFFSWKNIAASVAIIGLMSLFYWKISGVQQEHSLIKYASGYGETRQVMLSDSTAVILNANSSISLSNTWTDQSPREVWVDGEAFFKVRHIQNQLSPNAAFIVHAGNVNVHVIGTEFNVKSRHQQSSVVLNSGKVRLSNAQDEGVMMVPGEMVTYSDSVKTFVSKMVNPSLHIAWTKRQLVFENTTIREVSELLENNYGMKVIIKQPALYDKKITGVIPSISLPTILSTLEESFDVSIKQQDSTLTISKR